MSGSSAVFPQPVEGRAVPSGEIAGKARRRCCDTGDANRRGGRAPVPWSFRGSTWRRTCCGCDAMRLLPFTLLIVACGAGHSPTEALELMVFVHRTDPQPYFEVKLTRPRSGDGPAGDDGRCPVPLRAGLIANGVRLDPLPLGPLQADACDTHWSSRDLNLLTEDSLVLDLRATQSQAHFSGLSAARTLTVTSPANATLR